MASVNITEKHLEFVGNFRKYIILINFMYHKEIEAKYILLGTVHTGKSSFIHRVQYGSYPISNQTTIGIDYASLNLCLHHI